MGTNALKTGAESGIILALLKDSYTKCRLCGGGSWTQESKGVLTDNGDSGTSIKDLVDSAMSDPHTRGFLLGSEEAREYFKELGGQFDDGCYSGLYSIRGRTFLILEPEDGSLLKKNIINYAPHTSV
ncbi:hypothetical protein HYS31_01150 [Candidatus Woesearchaeota archaeon]|nr:hypothetical protein [Candidatus Woesearchaeota archaeon]